MKLPSILDKVVTSARNEGSAKLAQKIWRWFFPPRLKSFNLHAHRFSDRIGLEIGGPSEIFSKRGLAPVYHLAGRIDNNNYSPVTVWDDHKAADKHFFFNPDREPGRQYINEATDLAAIASESYDFVLSSHVLEHIANPLKALKEWIRALKPGGVLLLIVPHKDGTFDHLRPTTTLAHLIDDLNKNRDENDTTHLPEILSLHDLSLDPMAGTPEEFRARSLENAKNRCLHHHVFDTRLAIEAVNNVGLQILLVRPVLPMHIVVLAEKPGKQGTADNLVFLSGSYPDTSFSPFPSDHLSVNQVVPG